MNLRKRSIWCLGKAPSNSPRRGGCHPVGVRSFGRWIVAGLCFLFLLSGCRTPPSGDGGLFVKSEGVVADTIHFSDSTIYREWWKNDTIIIHEKEIITNYRNTLEARTDTVVIVQEVVKEDGNPVLALIKNLPNGVEAALVFLGVAMLVAVIIKLIIRKK